MDESYLINHEKLMKSFLSKYISSKDSDRDGNPIWYRLQHSFDINECIMKFMSDTAEENLKNLKWSEEEEVCIENIYNEHSFCLLAFNDENRQDAETLCGYIAFRLLTDHYRYCYIYEFQTIKKFQRKGIGKALLCELEKIIGKVFNSGDTNTFGKIKIVGLTCAKKNTVARTFYTNLGFYKTPFFDEEGETSLMFDRNIGTVMKAQLPAPKKTVVVPSKKINKLPKRMATIRTKF